MNFNFLHGLFLWITLILFSIIIWEKSFDSDYSLKAYETTEDINL